MRHNPGRVFINYCFSMLQMVRVVPVAAYSRNLESGTGDFGLFLDEGVLAIVGLFGTKLGLSLGF